ncbi:hypothetical protein ACG74X_18075 [Marivita sp. S0852]|uniref:hypothetical protein n=1 Tax=Marivita sp. S0852 TaxID=3373893 RepID=UPI0039828D2A
MKHLFNTGVETIFFDPPVTDTPPEADAPHDIARPMGTPPETLDESGDRDAPDWLSDGLDEKTPPGVEDDLSPLSHLPDEVRDWLFELFQNWQMDIEDLRPEPEQSSALLDRYTSNAENPDGYNIDIFFDGPGWTEELQRPFIEATEIISDVITDGVTDIAFTDGSVVDDIAINATLFSQESTLLGSAGPTLLRNDTLLPILAEIEINTANPAAPPGSELLEDTVLHELLHAVGLGTTWDTQGLLTDIGDEVRFVGDNAIEAYEAVFPQIFATDPGFGVPVENSTGNPGSDRGHWAEEVFGADEIMTPFLDSGEENPLTDLSIASLSDLGYQTTWDDMAIV